ncbi:hypothetical protein BP6252_12049 [Coleophoma cylindrospora]|uniref:Uncharacterized protein n=1 Tax=Coleophoma cylindrospora TaxID=1849047 RepID=A0A3D8QFN2_9HELO|nr:hypothetical protein BP6252_12049 [Coleophoma cylindrospora]
MRFVEAVGIQDAEQDQCHARHNARRNSKPRDRPGEGRVFQSVHLGGVAREMHRADGADEAHRRQDPADEEHRLQRKGTDVRNEPAKGSQRRVGAPIPYLPRTERKIRIRSFGEGMRGALTRHRDCSGEDTEAVRVPAR